MKKYNKIIPLLLLTTLCVFQAAAQKEAKSNCKEKIIGYVDQMRKVLTPTKGQVYYMKFATKTKFHKTADTPDTGTKTELWMTHNKIAMNDPNMKIYADDKNMFIVVPKIKTIYWNSSDPKLFAKNNSYQKFLEIEKIVVNTALQFTCSTKDKTDNIQILPAKEIEKKTGLTKQIIAYDTQKNTVRSVQNTFNTKNKIKTQTIEYQEINYKSTKKIKSPATYIFQGTQLKPIYKGYRIIDNRKK